MGYAEASKKRGVKLQLAWVPALRRWKKNVQGKQRYFVHPNTADGYSLALQDWAKLTQIDPDDPTGIRAKLRSYVAWYDQNGDPEGRGAMIEAWLALNIADHESGLELIRTQTEPQAETDAETIDRLLFAVHLGGTTVDEELKNTRLWEERFLTPKKKKSLTVAEGIKVFMDSFRHSVELGRRKSSTLRALNKRLIHVEKAVKGTIAAIDEQTIRNFHEYLSKSTMGGVRQKDVFQAFRSFVRWCWTENLLENMPRNISRAFEFASDAKPLEMFTSDEIISMLGNLPARGRAAVLLGLNCGFTVADLAALRKDNVDLAAGRITYKRIKTRRISKVPLVSYTLWPETVAALKETQSDHSELWFLTDDGQPLQTSKMIGDSVSSWSVIGTQWWKWKKAGLVTKSQKALRKTGATLISGGQYRGWQELYLGHTPSTVSGRHYEIRNGEPIPEFDRCLDWLRGEILGTTKPKPQ